MKGEKRMSAEMIHSDQWSVQRESQSLGRGCSDGQATGQARTICYRQTRDRVQISRHLFGPFEQRRDRAQVFRRVARSGTTPP